MTPLYNRYKRYASGGTADDNKFGNTAATIAGFGSGLLDAFGIPDEYGNQSSGVVIGKSALSGAGMGAQFGPVGAGVGAVLGAGVGLFTAGKQRREEQEMKMRKQALVDTNQRNMSAARIAGDPSLVQGYRNSGYFANGGEIGGLWSNNRKGFVDSTLQANKGLDFVKRLYEKNTPTIQVPGQPFRSTHLMGWDGGTKIAPQVVRQQDNKLHYLPTEDARDEYAAKTGEFIQFNHPEQAQWFAANGYKQGTGVLGKKAVGGTIQPPNNAVQTTVNRAPSSDPERDTIPSYLYFIKAAQENNNEGMNNALKHVRDVRGVPTATNLQFLAKNMKNSNINDLAKRGIGTETDPQMRLLYSTINENPDILNNFQYALPQSKDVAIKATGGTLEAPLTKAYMNGGKAKSMSSDTTEIQGNSHAEGGVGIPQLGAEVEGDETTSGNFVFSKELGFAQLHKPIAKAKGVIEKKPQTAERLNSMKLLNNQENKLALSQEYFKKLHGIQ